MPWIVWHSCFCCLWRADQCGMRRDKLWWGSSSSRPSRLRKQRPARTGLTRQNFTSSKTSIFCLTICRASKIDKKCLGSHLQDLPNSHRGTLIRLSSDDILKSSGICRYRSFYDKQLIKHRVLTFVLSNSSSLAYQAQLLIDQTAAASEETMNFGGIDS